jgi:hypothetical protein
LLPCLQRQWTFVVHHFQRPQDAKLHDGSPDSSRQECIGLDRHEVCPEPTVEPFDTLARTAIPFGA